MLVVQWVARVSHRTFAKTRKGFWGSWATLVVVATMSVGAGARDFTVPTIEVFIPSALADQAVPVHATVYVLDRIEQFQQTLSHQLPKDSTQAQRRVQQRLQAFDSQLSAQLENAAKGLLRAQEYGLDRYPAVVFNGKAVVYGVPNVTEATRHYRRWQGANDGT